MKISFKIKYLHFFAAALFPLAAAAADATSDGTRISPEERKARMEQRMAECKADPQKCRAEFQARREQWCNANPERCKQMQAHQEQREQHRAQCKADPEKCRAEHQARFAQRFKHADADGNGVISRAEAEKAMPRLVRHFDRIDVNHDGQISMDEIAAARKAHFERRQQRGGERREPSNI